MIQSRSLSTSYRICTPWLGSPISYASGYIRAHRTSVSSQSFNVELSSPPTYWMGFCTVGSSGSSLENTDSNPDWARPTIDTGVPLGARMRDAQAYDERRAGSNLRGRRVP